MISKISDSVRIERQWSWLILSPSFASSWTIIQDWVVSNLLKYPLLISFFLLIAVLGIFTMGTKQSGTMTTTKYTCSIHNAWANHMTQRNQCFKGSYIFIHRQVKQNKWFFLFILNSNIAMDPQIHSRIAKSLKRKEF